MFFRIIGILWVLLGIWWVMRPHVIQRRFRKGVKKARRRILFFIIILITGLFFSAAKSAHGIWAHIFLILAILSVIKSIFFLTSKAADRLIDWWAQRPLWLWRLWAVGFILIGLLLQKVK